jgi:hypothetical protein
VSYADVPDGIQANPNGPFNSSIVGLASGPVLASDRIKVETSCSILWEGVTADGDSLSLILYRDGLPVANKEVAIKGSNGLPAETLYEDSSFLYVETPLAGIGHTYSVQAVGVVGGVGPVNYMWSNTSIAVSVLTPA